MLCNLLFIETVDLPGGKSLTIIALDDDDDDDKPA